MWRPQRGLWVPLSPGVVLRETHTADSAKLFDLFQRNNERVVEYLEKEEYTFESAKDAERRVVAWHHNGFHTRGEMDLQGLKLVIVASSGQFAGFLRVDFETSNVRSSLAYVEYFVDEAFEGRGLVSRAVDAVVKVLETEQSRWPKRVVAVRLLVHPRNVRSRRVASRLGFVEQKKHVKVPDRMYVGVQGFQVWAAPIGGRHSRLHRELRKFLAKSSGLHDLLAAWTALHAVGLLDAGQREALPGCAALMKSEAGEIHSCGGSRAPRGKPSALSITRRAEQLRGEWQNSTGQRLRVDVSGSVESADGSTASFSHMLEGKFSCETLTWGRWAAIAHDDSHVWWTDFKSVAAWTRDAPSRRVTSIFASQEQGTVAILAALNGAWDVDTGGRTLSFRVKGRSVFTVSPSGQEVVLADEIQVVRSDVAKPGALRLGPWYSEAADPAFMWVHWTDGRGASKWSRPGSKKSAEPPRKSEKASLLTPKSDAPSEEQSLWQGQAFSQACASAGVPDKGPPMWRLCQLRRALSGAGEVPVSPETIPADWKALEGVWFEGAARIAVAHASVTWGTGGRAPIEFVCGRWRVGRLSLLLASESELRWALDNEGLARSVWTRSSSATSADKTPSAAAKLGSEDNDMNRPVLVSPRVGKLSLGSLMGRWKSHRGAEVVLEPDCSESGAPILKVFMDGLESEAAVELRSGAVVWGSLKPTDVSADGSSIVWTGGMRAVEWIRQPDEALFRAGEMFEQKTGLKQRMVWPETARPRAVSAPPSRPSQRCEWSLPVRWALAEGRAR